MTKYVLEILDGDQAGTTLELPGGKLRMGRRADNDLVLRDEKCSGHHAEISFEDGGYVLRDLDSTNGSLIDGRKISEVALTNLDIFQLGRVRIRFQAEGAGEELADMQVSRLDRSSLGKKKGLGLGSVLLILLLLAGGGALAWLEFFAPQGSSLAGPRERAVLRVAGNLLPAAASDFEGDEIGWDLQAAGTGFEAGFGARQANTGSGYLEARSGEGSATFALARLSEPLSVLAGTPLRIRASLRTEGSGQIAIRVLFSSSQGGPVLRTGSILQSYDAYQEVELIETVPQGMDLVSLEILGFLPAEDALIACDDLALLSDRSLNASGIDFSCRDGRSLRGIGGSLMVTGPEASLLGIRPLPADPALQELAAENLLVSSDMGFGIDVEP
ncbi:MAG: FHA domain-containing protein, partial [Planctomycetota bacterium]